MDRLDPAGFLSTLLHPVRQDAGQNAVLLQYEIEAGLDSASFANAFKPNVIANYTKPEIYARQLLELGDADSATLVRDLLPTKHRVRAGEFGEILLGSFIESIVDIAVPVKKLRFKDGRDNPVRGVDSLGAEIRDGVLRFAKGEAKVRSYLATAVADEVHRSLVGASGDVPTYAALYIVQHAGVDDIDLVRACEKFARGLVAAETIHVFLAAYGRSVEDVLPKFFNDPPSRRKTYVVGITLRDYKKLIPAIFHEAGKP